MTTRCLTLAIFILAARTVSAQTASVPRVELGGTFSAILPIVAADGPVFLVGGVVGPFGDRGGINGIYGADARLVVRHGRSGERTLSMTVGVAGGVLEIDRLELVR